MKEYKNKTFRQLSLRMTPEVHCKLIEICKKHRETGKYPGLKLTNLVNKIVSDYANKNYK